MSSIGEWFNQTIASVTGKTPQQHADNIKTALALPPSVTTDQGSAKMLGVPQEGGGMTCTGGKRRKGRRGGKKRMTQKRRGGGNCPIKCPGSTDGVHKFGSAVKLGDVKESQCTLCRCVKSV